jgi:hypothetical protein
MSLNIKRKLMRIVWPSDIDTNIFKNRLYDKHQRYQEKYGSKKAETVEVPEDEQWTEQNQKDLCKYAAEARMSSSFFMFKR